MPACKSVEAKFKKIRKKAEVAKERQEITSKLVDNRVKDLQGWKAEWIKYGGEEMEKCLARMFNAAEDERIYLINGGK